MWHSGAIGTLQSVCGKIGRIPKMKIKREQIHEIKMLRSILENPVIETQTVQIPRFAKNCGLPALRRHFLPIGFASARLGKLHSCQRLTKQVKKND